MVVPFMTMYMTQYIGVGIGKAAFVMSIFGAGAIIGALIGGRITDKVGYYYVQLFTLLGGGILFIVLGLMKSYTGICVASFFLSMVNEAFRPANAVATYLLDVAGGAITMQAPSMTTTRHAHGRCACPLVNFNIK